MPFHHGPAHGQQRGRAGAAVDSRAGGASRPVPQEGDGHRRLHRRHGRSRGGRHLHPAAPGHHPPGRRRRGSNRPSGSGAASTACAATRPASTGPMPRRAGRSWASWPSWPAPCWSPPPATRTWPRPGPAGAHRGPGCRRGARRRRWPRHPPRGHPTEWCRSSTPRCATAERAPPSESMARRPTS